MKHAFPLLLAACWTFVTSFTQAAAPFSLTVVPSKSQPPPGGRSISMAAEKADALHVILTNISGKAQAIFETWNSWDYQVISFELTLPDGQRTVLSVAPKSFTRNFPSTFYLLPGEHQVFPIRLDLKKDLPVRFETKWVMNPEVSLDSETAITLKAIYKVGESPASKEQHVWAGRVESKSYPLTLRHW